MLRRYHKGEGTSDADRRPYADAARTDGMVQRVQVPGGASAGSNRYPAGESAFQKSVLFIPETMAAAEEERTFSHTVLPYEGNAADFYGVKKMFAGFAKLVKV